MSILPPLPSTFPHADPLTTLLPHLLPRLPHSLPLVRRLQFHLSSLHATVLATFAPSLPSTSKFESFAACWFGESSQSVDFSPQPPSHQVQYSTDVKKLLAIETPYPTKCVLDTGTTYADSIDRTRRPETECWIFSTYEIAHNKPTTNNNILDSKANQHKIQDASTARSQLLALLLAVAETASPLSTAESRPHIVLGSVHISLVLLLAGDEPLPERDSLRSPQRSQPRWQGRTDSTSVLAGASSGYIKWLIPPPRSGETEPSESEYALPPGYSFGAFQPGELARVVASTAIPRTEATLATLGSVCVRDSGGGLVSWGFLGVDGSLSSLYTEEGGRGKGLAKAVARRLVEGVGGGSEEDGVRMGYRGVGEGEGWAHSDIEVENKGSAAVARAIGGTVGWECRWVGVDLERVREVVSRLYCGDRGLGELGRS